MGWLVIVAWVVLAATLPDLLPPALGLSSHAPDLWVALVIYLACRGRGYVAVGWGMVIGLLRDAHSLDPLGTHGFVLGLVGLLFCEGRSDRGAVSGPARLACVALGSVAASWAYLLRALPMGGGFSMQPLVAAFPTALWTSLAALPLYLTVDRFGALDDVAGRRHGLSA